MLGNAVVHLEFSFPTGEIMGLGRSSWCSAMLIWGRGDVVKVKPLLPLSCSLFSFCVLGMYFSLNSRFWDFHCGVWSTNSCSLNFW